MHRGFYHKEIASLLRGSPVLALLGPRQCGKTTLARDYWQSQQLRAAQPKSNYFDLENVIDLARLDTPMLGLESLRGLVVIDEVQRRPELFETLRVLVDRPKQKTKFLILGSASRDLIQQGSETLAGRIQFLEVTPFSQEEVRGSKTHALERLWLRGGFPRAFLAPSERASVDWREAYIRTFLERDIPALGIQIPPLTLRRFWMMLTHYHGQIFNASEIGKSLGIADTTAKRYLDLLAGTFMVRRLSPWFENIQKRQVKLPKIYFRDSGIYHQLLGVPSKAALMTNPKLGASWEGFALEQLLRQKHVREEDAFFWGVHGQAELDLLLFEGGKRHGYEFKYADAPKLSSSMHQAIELLKLDTLTVVVPGDAAFKLAAKVEVRGLDTL